MTLAKGGLVTLSLKGSAKGGLVGLQVVVLLVLFGFQWIKKGEKRLKIV